MKLVDAVTWEGIVLIVWHDEPTSTFDWTLDDQVPPTVGRYDNITDAICDGIKERVRLAGTRKATDV